MVFNIVEYVRTDNWEGALISDKNGKLWITTGTNRWVLNSKKAQQIKYTVTEPIIDTEQLHVRWQWSYPSDRLIK